VTSPATVWYFKTCEDSWIAVRPDETYACQSRSAGMTSFAKPRSIAMS
jgi:hypothetical protein